MKKLKYILSFTLLNLLITTPAFAAAPICGKDTIHCAYITGLTPAYDNGRYIKITDKGRQSIDCVTGNGAYEITNEDGKDYLGSNKDNFYICKNQNGDGCQLVGIDNFTVTDMGNNQYQANPPGFPIDLSAVANQYSPCHVFSTKYRLGG